MATFILINAITISAGIRMLPGTTVDDAVTDTAAIIAAGGELFTASNTIVAAAAAKAMSAKLQRGADEQVMQSIMRSGVSLATAGILASDVRNIPIHLRAVSTDAPAANPYVNATPNSITLPENAKCISQTLTPPTAFGNAWARAGSGTLGSLTGGSSQTPAGGAYGVSPTGDLLFNQTDNWTSIDFAYMPERYDVVSGTYSCTAGSGVVAGLPSGLIFILEAEALAGGVTGKCIVGTPAATAPATGAARLSLGKTGVFFCIADAVTSVRLKLGVVPAVQL